MITASDVIIPDSGAVASQNPEVSIPAMPDSIVVVASRQMDEWDPDGQEGEDDALHAATVREEPQRGVAPRGDTSGTAKPAGHSRLSPWPVWHRADNLGQMVLRTRNSTQINYSAERLIDRYENCLRVTYGSLTEMKVLLTA